MDPSGPTPGMRTSRLHGTAMVSHRRPPKSLKWHDWECLVCFLAPHAQPAPFHSRIYFTGRYRWHTGCALYPIDRPARSIREWSISIAVRRRGNAPVKALFIGNSFTARNDLPGLIAQLAVARRRRLQHRLINAGGASLRQHRNAGHALKAIQHRACWGVTQIKICRSRHHGCYYQPAKRPTLANEERRSSIGHGSSH